MKRIKHFIAFVKVNPTILIVLTIVNLFCLLTGTYVEELVSDNDIFNFIWISFLIICMYILAYIGIYKLKIFDKEKEDG